MILVRFLQRRDLISNTQRYVPDILTTPAHSVNTSSHSHRYPEWVVALSCSNSPSWPSRSSCHVSAATHVPRPFRLVPPRAVEPPVLCSNALAEPVEMPRLRCKACRRGQQRCCEHVRDPLLRVSRAEQTIRFRSNPCVIKSPTVVVTARPNAGCAACMALLFHLQKS